MEKKVQRESNIELLRIVMMLVIIAHHYVVNSGLSDCFESTNIHINTIWYQLIGGGGKTAINVFLIISGYFMCNSKVALKKWVQLFLELCFYKIIINVLFLVAGYHPFGLLSVIKDMIPVFLGLKTGNDSFMSLYMVLFLVIPFANKMIKNLTKAQHGILLGILLVTFSFTTTFLFQENWEGLGWYVTMYLLGAYLKRYPCKKLDNFKTGLCLSVVMLALYVLEILVVDFVGVKVGYFGYWHIFTAANSTGAVVTSAALFILFKNMHIKNSKFINTVSSTTLGVLLIHANGAAMRNWLWVDLLKNKTMYEAPIVTVIIHSVLSVLGIYVICVIIDLARKKFLEKPVMKYMDKCRWAKIELYEK